MRLPFGLFVLLLLCASPALAQEGAPPPQEQSPAPQEPKRVTPKFELSGGYAYRSSTTPANSKIWLNGWYASFDYNLYRWLGVEAEGMGVYHSSQNISDPSYGKTNIYGFMAGPKLYPLGHRKVTAFGHVLFGAARYSNTTPAYGGTPVATTTASAKAWEAGGGLDWNFSRHWGARLFQFDFGSANFFGANTGGAKRITAGIVYRFGEK